MNDDQREQLRIEEEIDTLASEIMDDILHGPSSPDWSVELCEWCRSRAQVVVLAKRIFKNWSPPERFED